MKVSRPDHTRRGPRNACAWQSGAIVDGLLRYFTATYYCLLNVILYLVRPSRVLSAARLKGIDLLSRFDFLGLEFPGTTEFDKEKTYDVSAPF